MSLKHLVYGLIAVMALFTISGRSQINTNEPPFSLTVSQVDRWRSDSKLADPDNVSRVSLAPRFVASLDGKPALDSEVKVLIAPDGMNNFANYIQPQNKFNLYNFTHWSHIDVLNWFAGTATETVNIPARPWVETAHRNGVKVIGSIFLAVSQYGGKIETVESLLRRDVDGGFPVAHQLIAIARYYGFDGWLINQETDLTLVKDANGVLIAGRRDYQKAAHLGKEILAFMKYLTQIAPPAMEIHWYDAMLLDGSIEWQNQLNQKNTLFLQDGQGEAARAADAIFINYSWDTAMLANSHQKVKQLNRSPYEMYFGVDLWPDRNAQQIFTKSDWLRWLFPGKGNKALSSIALFANNVNFNFAGNDKIPAYSDFWNNSNDQRNFYDTETRLFAGDDLNIYIDDPTSGWPGIGRYVPAKSTLSSLPFKTSFNTGHGKHKAAAGKKIAGAWHDVGQQDVLPTWQFAIKGNRSLEVFYDFEEVFNGGSSLKLNADLSLGDGIIPLYQSDFLLDESSRLKLVFKQQANQQNLFVWLQTVDKEWIQFPLNSTGEEWSVVPFSLKKHAGKVIRKIGLMVSDDPDNKNKILSANIGFIEIN